MLQNPHVFPTFHKIDNPLHLRRRTTSEHPEVVREPWCLNILTSNVLCATTARTISTSQLSKAVWRWGVLYILTSKCASRPNGVQSFDIATSKRGPTLRFFESEQYRCTAAKMRPTTVCQIVDKWKTKAETFQSHRYMDFSGGRLSAEIFEYWRYLFYLLIYFRRFIFFIFLFCDLCIFIFFSSFFQIFSSSYLPTLISSCLLLLPACPPTLLPAFLFPSWPLALLKSCPVFLTSCPLSCCTIALLSSFLLLS